MPDLKIGILAEKKDAPPAPAFTMEPFLEVSSIGTLFLKAKDRTGEVWHIGRIGTDGILQLESGIPLRTGWPVDSSGYLKVKN